jgi:hypothetical protein
MSQESTYKNPNYLHRHKLPEVSQPKGAVDEALIWSTQNFTEPTNLNTEVSFEDGSKYFGQWMKGAKHGLGRLDWEQGSYEGEWKENKF